LSFPTAQARYRLIFQRQDRGLHQSIGCDPDIPLPRHICVSNMRTLQPAEGEMQDGGFSCTVEPEKVIGTNKTGADRGIAQKP
jgi:hypothetical protein